MLEINILNKTTAEKLVYRKDPKGRTGELIADLMFHLIDIDFLHETDRIEIEYHFEEVDYYVSEVRYALNTISRENDNDSYGDNFETTTKNMMKGC